MHGRWVVINRGGATSQYKVKVGLSHTKTEKITTDWNNSIKLALAGGIEFYTKANANVSGEVNAVVVATGEVGVNQNNSLKIEGGISVTGRLNFSKTVS